LKCRSKLSGSAITIPLLRRKMPKPSGTSIAVIGPGGKVMEGIARVSAVFLLIMGMWVCGVSSGESRHQGTSRPRPVPDDVGVGTKVAARGEKVSREDDVGGGARVRPLTVFRGVEKGWRNGTPKPFERYLGKGKVRLDLGEGGPRGVYFTRSQAYYLLADYLRRTQTLDIELARMSDGTDKASRPYALLDRKCRYRNGVTGKEVVFVSLRLEDDQWVISELRAVPAR
jgi:hypothetical protein